MKPIVLILASCFMTAISFGYEDVANDLEIVNEDGTNFILVINGKQVNDDYTNQVSVKNLKKDVLEVRLIFEDRRIPDIVRNVLFVNLPGQRFNNKPVKTVFKIKERKGKLRLKKVSRKFKPMAKEPKVEFEVD